VAQAGGLATVPAPEADVIEMDEVCIRLSPSLWLWLAVSRLVGQVLGFALGDRTDAMLALAWSDVPEDYRDKPVRSDHWGAYARFFASFRAGQHQACDKGTGQTSRVEGWNTKWRQRQSGLVRRSCGVCERIADDVLERFLILVEQHNRECVKRWKSSQEQPT
jgi:IS1 family transposase